MENINKIRKRNRRELFYVSGDIKLGIVQYDMNSGKWKFTRFIKDSFVC